MSTTLTVQNLPDELHSWLAERALTNQHSIDAEVIALLVSLRQRKVIAPKVAMDDALDIITRCATLPDLDRRSAEDILGYDQFGIPQ